MTLMSVFAALAMILAVVGLYGVLSYAVTRRTREIGIRMALGARPSEIRRLVLRDACWLIAAGVLAGVAASLVVLRAMSSLLYGPGSETLAVVVLNSAELGRIGVTAALSVLVTLVVVLPAAALWALSRRARA